MSHAKEITGIDHTGETRTYKAGDKVKVYTDSNEGPWYIDEVRMGFQQNVPSYPKLYDGVAPAVTLKGHSWTWLSSLEPA